MGYSSNYAILFLFFQKVPFDMDFIRKIKMISSFFIRNIKKTCAALGSLRSFSQGQPKEGNPVSHVEQVVEVTIREFIFRQVLTVSLSLKNL